MKKLKRKDESVNPSTHPNYNRDENGSQPGVLVAPKSNLTVARVPENLAFADDRCRIKCASWCVGTPVTRDGVCRAIERIGNKHNHGSITIAIEGGAA